MGSHFYPESESIYEYTTTATKRQTPIHNKWMIYLISFPEIFLFDNLTKDLAISVDIIRDTIIYGFVPTRPNKGEYLFCSSGQVIGRIVAKMDCVCWQGERGPIKTRPKSPLLSNQTIQRI